MRPEGRSPEDRERIAEGRPLDAAMSALGVVFLLVVVGEGLATRGTPLSRGFAIAGWGLWAIFVGEFIYRLVVAPDTGRFLKRNWWQIVFLVLPFLRIFRLLHTLRVARAGRVLGSAVRAGRSAGRKLTDRVAWLSTLTAIVILASSQLLFEFGELGSYATALHAAALSSVTGEPIQGGGTITRVVEIVLAIYSVVVFAALAGILGAYFLERRDATPSARITQAAGDREPRRAG